MNDSAEKSCVLVVDDTPENIDIANGILKSEYRVRAAISGEKALNFISRNQPDLILLDVMMPDMDGYEVCRRLKSNETSKHIPVIFVTGKTEPSEIAKAMDLGAADYLVKPIDPKMLLEKVRQHLRPKITR